MKRYFFVSGLIMFLLIGCGNKDADNANSVFNTGDLIQESTEENSEEREETFGETETVGEVGESSEEPGETVEDTLKASTEGDNTTSTDSSKSPSTDPSKSLGTNSSKSPSTDPSKSPGTNPSKSPGTNPSKSPGTNPSKSPSTNPSKSPSTDPSKSPNTNPSTSPSTAAKCNWKEKSRTETIDCFANKVITTIVYTCSDCKDTKEEKQEKTGQCDWQWVPKDFEGVSCESTRPAYNTCVKHGTQTAEMPLYVEGRGHDIYVTRTERLGCIGETVEFYGCRNCQSLYKSPEVIEKFQGTGHSDANHDSICDNCDNRCVAGDRAHQYATITEKEPTCNDNGICYEACTFPNCNERKASYYTPQLNCNYIVVSETQAPVCVTTGVRTYECTGCGHRYDEWNLPGPHADTDNDGICNICNEEV